MWLLKSTVDFPLIDKITVEQTKILSSLGFSQSLPVQQYVMDLFSNNNKLRAILQNTTGLDQIPHWDGIESHIGLFVSESNSFN